MYSDFAIDVSGPHLEGSSAAIFSIVIVAIILYSNSFAPFQTKQWDFASELFFKAVFFTYKDKATRNDRIIQFETTQKINADFEDASEIQKLNFKKIVSVQWTAWKMIMLKIRAGVLLWGKGNCNFRDSKIAKMFGLQRKLSAIKVLCFWVRMCKLCILTESFNKES